MSINGTLIGKAANGALSVVALPVATINFNGGTPANGLAQLVIAPFASGFNPEVFVGGLAYTNTGALLTDAIGALAGYTTSGLPYTINGCLATDVSSTPATYSPGGVPIDAASRVCLTTSLPI
jgi:hypothetical protein